MTDVASSHRGSRKKTIWTTAEGQHVEITERQKEIMKLSDELPTAQAVADRLGISPNAVYVSRRRVKDIIEAAPSNGASAPFAGHTPRRVIDLAAYQNEQKSLDIDAEVQEVAGVVQGKLVALTEAAEFHQAELEKIERARDGLKRMLDNVLDGSPVATA